MPWELTQVSLPSPPRHLLPCGASQLYSRLGALLRVDASRWGDRESADFLAEQGVEEADDLTAATGPAGRKQSKKQQTKGKKGRKGGRSSSAGSAKGEGEEAAAAADVADPALVAVLRRLLALAKQVPAAAEAAPAWVGKAIVSLVERREPGPAVHGMLDEHSADPDRVRRPNALVVWYALELRLLLLNWKFGTVHQEASDLPQAQVEGPRGRVRCARSAPTCAGRSPESTLSVPAGGAGAGGGAARGGGPPAGHGARAAVRGRR